MVTDQQQNSNASQGFIGLTVFGASAMWLAGMTLSFSSVKNAAEPYVGGYAPVVPLGVDLGIIAFTALDLLMAQMRMRTRWLRFFPWGLIAATIYLNVADETDWLGRVIHAVLPLAAVVVVEAGAHAIRVKAGLADGEVDERGRLGLALWFLAPFSTLALWRRLVVTRAATDDYIDARIVAARWRDDKGFLWRWKVPREQRVLYRYGQLRPTGVVVDVPARPAIEAPSVNDPPVALQAPAEPATDVEGPEATPRASGPVDVDDLLPVAREIRHDLGRVPGWKVMAAEVRKRGLPCGTPKAQALVAALKAEPNGDGQ